MMNKPLKLRKLVNLSSIEVNNINSEHEEMIKIGPDEDGNMCFGGIVLMNLEKNIVLKNTLDLRAELAFQKGLPHLRRILLGKK